MRCARGIGGVVVDEISKHWTNMIRWLLNAIFRLETRPRCSHQVYQPKVTVERCRYELGHGGRCSDGVVRPRI